jgi:hypothetical protein
MLFDTQALNWNVRFKAVTAVNIKITFLKAVTPCSQSNYPEDGGNRFLQNIKNFLSDPTASHPFNELKV